MEQFTGTSLRTRLFLTVLITFLPLAVMILYVAHVQKKLEMETILHRTKILARAAASEEGQQMESTRHLLTAVADAFFMVQESPDRLKGLLAHLLHQTEGYAGFGVLDTGGHLVAGSGLFVKKRNYSDSPWFRNCLHSETMTMFAYPREHSTGEPILYLAQPAKDIQGKAAAVAFCAVYLDWMNRSLFRLLAELPGGSRLTLLDEFGGILRYEADAESWSVPNNFDAELRRRILQMGSGALSGSDEVGLPRIYAFAPLPRTIANQQDAVVLEVPRALALGASQHTFTRNVVLLTLSVAMASLVIWWTGDRVFIRRIRQMVRISRRLASGDLDARVGQIGARDEINHLAGVFDEMASSLQARIQKEEQSKASLKASREKLRRLAAYQQEVREQERIRIAREIHDQLGQSLTILKMDLAWLTRKEPYHTPELTEKMTAMAEIIDDSLKDLHAVTSELRPVILDDFGLSAAIEWQLEEFQQRSGLRCRMESVGSEPDLTPDQATALFRIFQETLTNVARHAQATEVTVRLEGRAGEWILQVRDNGRGITQVEIDGSDAYGLLGIRERLFPWNGRVSFEGKAGEGTCVTVHLPIAEEERIDD